MKELLGKIQERKARIGIMGLGYVGLLLALTFAKKFPVVGYDPNKAVVDGLRKGESPIWDITDQEVQAHLERTLHPSSEKTALADCDFIPHFPYQSEQ